MFEVEFKPAPKPLFNVRICINKRLNTDNLPNCAGRGSRALADRLEHEIAQEQIPAKVLRGPCMNNCAHGPNLKIQGAEFISLDDDTSDARVAEIMAGIRREADKRIASAVGGPSGAGAEPLP